MNILSCDQSLSHCAWTLWENDKPFAKGIIMTGADKSKTKNKLTTYFPIITQQIDHVCNELCRIIREYNVDAYVMEGVAQGSYGDAKGYLITLFRAIEDTIICATKLTQADLYYYAPTSIKSFARQFLPESEQKVKKLKDVKVYAIDPMTKKKVVVETIKKEVECLVEMKKPLMVKSCKIVAPNGWLDGINLSQGLSDFADSFLIGYKFVKENKICS